MGRFGGTDVAAEIFFHVQLEVAFQFRGKLAFAPPAREDSGDSGHPCPQAAHYHASCSTHAVPVGGRAGTRDAVLLPPPLGGG